ncbi:DUF2474 domain-containing protein [Cellvibrio zantedeschiae]|uniref:DUF2474 domain-containing protein n=1 Tax=Cellvibrio zantedeschiae TaxID=1237077 RepID=UPI0016732854|nr:DUF2474 domain-containing protein [Cellvibrio zantedeschiae]
MDKPKINIPPNDEPQDFSWWSRVAWLVGIWAMSVVVLGIVAFAIRKLMTAAGMSS